jgi:hypothetical protein
MSPTADSAEGESWGQETDPGLTTHISREDGPRVTFSVRIDFGGTFTVRDAGTAGVAQ